MRSKYGAKKSTIDGITFDSKSELDYYIYLKENKDVQLFELQPRYELQPSFKRDGKHIQDIQYVADFLVVYKDGTISVVDIKGMPTSDAKIKRKIFLYKYPGMKLEWLIKYKGEWVDYFENEKRKRDNKKRKNLDILDSEI